MEFPSNFRMITGSVIKASKETVANIKSVGGGGSVYQGSGFISAPQIYSTNTVVWDVWLHTKLGEKDFQIKGADIPIREGQFVSVLFCGDCVIQIFNHNTQVFYTLVVGKDIYPEIKGGIGCLNWLLAISISICIAILIPIFCVLISIFLDKNYSVWICILLGVLAAGIPIVIAIIGEIRAILLYFDHKKKASAFDKTAAKASDLFLSQAKSYSP